MCLWNETFSASMDESTLFSRPLPAVAPCIVIGGTFFAQISNSSGARFLLERRTIGIFFLTSTVTLTGNSQDVLLQDRLTRRR